MSLPDPSKPPRRRALDLVLPLAVLGGAVAQAAANMVHINPDGVVYLEMAHGLASAEWHHVLNSYWSPLLPVLLAPVVGIAPAAPPYDHFLAYGLVLTSFFFAAAGWWYLLGEVRRARPGHAPGADATFTVFAWSLFAWVALGHVRLEDVVPDMLAAALIFAAVGATLRAGERERKAGPASLLAGCLWGLAGLSKTAMLPLGGVGLLSLVVAAPSVPERVRRGGLALLGWLLVAGPYVLGLSLQAGHPTIGSAPGLNYAWSVHQEARIGTSGETPIPVVALDTEPEVTNVAELDPARFSSPGPTRLPDPRSQLRVLLQSFERYWFIGSPLLAGLLALALLGRRRDWSWRRWQGIAPLWLPALAGLGMYALIIVHPRYVGAFFGLATLALVVGVGGVTGRSRPRRAILWALTGVLLAYAGLATADSVMSVSPPDVAIARTLEEVGLARGDRVAVVGNAADIAGWLRGAGLRVAAVIPDDGRFQLASPETREAALREMAAAGASWVVFPRPIGELTREWRAVVGTGMAVRRLE